MDEAAVNEAFRVGYERTVDLCNFVPDDQEGEAELVGIFVCVSTELSERWGMSVKEAVDHVTTVLV